MYVARTLPCFMHFTSWGVTVDYVTLALCNSPDMVSTWRRLLRHVPSSDRAKTLLSTSTNRALTLAGGMVLR